MFPLLKGCSTVQKIDRAAPGDFFREVDGAYEYLCRVNKYLCDVITSILAAETVITNAAYAAATFIYSGDCYSADDCLRYVFGPRYAAVNAIYTQFRVDCLT